MRSKSNIATLVGAALTLCIAIPTGSARAQEEVVLSERDEDLVDAYYVMQGVTLGLMGATALGGLVNLYNLPTSFGDGACERNEALFGDYGCNKSLSLVHGIFGIASIASYTATAALAFAAPDLDQGSEDTVTDVLGVAHGVGLGLTGVLGILAANPNLIGLHGNAASEFSRHMRIVHWLVALTTVSLFTTHLIVDHVD